MKRASILTFCVVFLATALCFAQQAGQLNVTSSDTRWCDLSGTWYGGSDWKYSWVIVPTGYGTYWSQSTAWFDNHAFGYIAWSDWNGEIIKGKGQVYDSYGISLWVWPPAEGADPQQPPPPEQLEMDIVRSHIRFVNNCDTFQSAIDVYAGYLNWTEDKVPFATDPDVNYLAEFYGGGPLVETYHRMPTTCPKCPYASTLNPTLMPDKTKLRGKTR